jgi:glycosyltransferase involved in cell wall biosynthesis
MSIEPLRIAIDAQILPGQEGGIEQVLIGLAKGLSRLQDSDHEYIFIGHWENPYLLKPYLGLNQRIVAGPPPSNLKGEQIKNLLGSLRKPAGIIRRQITQSFKGASTPRLPRMPQSDGFYEGLGCDVLHVTYPMHAVKSSLPTVFSIYDLQHRHFPQFFTLQHLSWREEIYPAMFNHADVIATDSMWVKEDVSSQYGIDPDKVYAVPLAPPTDAYAEISSDAITSTVARYGLPGRFILYPALTYEHKNHIGLLEAIALLRDRHKIEVNLICTGAKRHFWTAIERRIEELHLQAQVMFPGFVDSVDLKVMYQLSDFVVLPSLFEGAGLPLLEAFREGKAVACSDIPAFREYGGRAAQFFDPLVVSSIADRLNELISSEPLRMRLAKAGSEQVTEFSWERTARIYRALYRKAAGREMSFEDEELLRSSQHPQSQPVAV